jgi:hypothetical protein
VWFMSACNNIRQYYRIAPSSMSVVACLSTRKTDRIRLVWIWSDVWCCLPRFTHGGCNSSCAQQIRRCRCRCRERRLVCLAHRTRYSSRSELRCLFVHLCCHQPATTNSMKALTTIKVPALRVKPATRAIVNDMPLAVKCARYLLILHVLILQGKQIQ